MKKLCAMLFFAMIIFPSLALSWTHNLTFESGAVESAAADTFDVIEHLSDASTTLDSTIKNSGNYSARSNFLVGGDGSNLRVNIANLTTGASLWIRAYIRFSDDFSFASYGGSSIAKFFRPWMTDSGNNFGVVGGQASILTEDPPVRYDTGYYWSSHLAEWICSEVSITNFSQSNQMLRWWINGILVLEQAHENTPTEITDVRFFDTINGGWGNNQEAWLDDIVITNETPTNVDEDDNPMIGPIGWGGEAGCDADHLELCTTQELCEAASLNWCGGACQVAACPTATGATLTGVSRVVTP